MAELCDGGGERHFGEHEWRGVCMLKMIQASMRSVVGLGVMVLACLVLQVRSQCATSPMSSSCCDWPYCCAATDAKNCDLSGCESGTCAGGTPVCNYPDPPTCMTGSCPTGPVFPLNCPQICTALDDCVTPFQCDPDKPNCTEGPLSGEDCLCCPPFDNNDCPVVGGPGEEVAECVYSPAPTCTSTSCPTGTVFPMNCPQICSETGNCADPFDCTADVPTCTDGPISKEDCACCPPFDGNGCPVIGNPGDEVDSCMYSPPPTCDVNSCPSGTDFPMNCPQVCTANGSCDDPFTCTPDIPTCSEFAPINQDTCTCGCQVDLDCIGLGLSCPECDTATGVCSSRDCGSKACCKATRGNDLVCANGCGRSNVCFRTECIGSGCPSACSPPGTVCSEFDSTVFGVEDVDGDGSCVYGEDVLEAEFCVECARNPTLCPRQGTEAAGSECDA